MWLFMEGGRPPQPAHHDQDPAVMQYRGIIQIDAQLNRLSEAFRQEMRVRASLVNLMAL
jgi:hypothetical protein